MESFKDYVPVLFLTVGYGGIIYSLFTVAQSIGAKEWKAVKATIVASNIDTSCNNDECTYEAKIRYSYAYRGITYSSNKIAFGYLANSVKFFSRRITDKYMRGNIATVRLNPKNPKSSVLLAGIRPFHLFNIIFFIVFTAIAQNVYSKSSVADAVDRDNKHATRHITPQ